jgi:hypothetical protein
VCTGVWAQTAGGRRSGSASKRENRQYSLGGGWWWDRLHFSTGRSKSNYLPSRNRRQHDNQTSDDGVGLKRLGDGVASSVFQGMFVEFSAGGGVRHSDFETRRTKAIEPPGPRQQRHENQIMDERVGALVARGVCMGGRSDLPFLPCCCHGYIMSGMRRLEGLF